MSNLLYHAVFSPLLLLGPSWAQKSSLAPYYGTPSTYALCQHYRPSFTPTKQETKLRSGSFNSEHYELLMPASNDALSLKYPHSLVYLCTALLDSNLGCQEHKECYPPIHAAKALDTFW